MSNGIKQLSKLRIQTSAQNLYLYLGFNFKYIRLEFYSLSPANVKHKYNMKNVSLVGFLTQHSYQTNKVKGSEVTF